MSLIRYVGLKPHGRADTVTTSGAIWTAPGDVQEVPDQFGPTLLKHPDIWERVDQVENRLPGSPQDTKPEPKAKGKSKGKSKEPEPPPKKFVIATVSGTEIVLDDMDDQALRAFVDEHSLPIDQALAGDELRSAIYEAATEE